MWLRSELVAITPDYDQTKYKGFGKAAFGNGVLKYQN